MATAEAFSAAVVWTSMASVATVFFLAWAVPFCLGAQGVLYSVWIPAGVYLESRGAVGVGLHVLRDARIDGKFMGASAEGGNTRARSYYGPSARIACRRLRDRQALLAAFVSSGGTPGSSATK